MLDYQYPKFDFKAPLELARRMEENETKNQAYRSDFMRDRDRIMYSSAFRRLAGKTQIYLTGKDDHQRNRLTHTLEVSQIARTISQALGLDCDLTEAIALGHDLGHTPFGHAGEEILHQIMVPNSKINIKKSPMSQIEPTDVNRIPCFGFKHNIQSVRVAASLERSYGNAGLNLTNFTLWGIMHHSSLEYKPERMNASTPIPEYKKQYYQHMCLTPSCNREAWSFEAFVVGQADEIAQWHHDLEDALHGKAMTHSDVCRTIQQMLKPIMSEEDIDKLHNLKKRTQTSKKYVADLSRIVVNTLVNQLIECSLYNLDSLWNKYVGDVEQKNHFFKMHSWTEPEIQRAIGFSKIGERDQNVDFFQKEYPSIISEKIHHSRDVERMNAKGKYIIKKLFQAYYSHPQQLPDGIISHYMIDMGRYANLDSAAKAGTGAVRKQFESFISSSSSFTVPNQLALMRAICDHIAGMTDHYAIEEYKNLYG